MDSLSLTSVECLRRCLLCLPLSLHSDKKLDNLMTYPTFCPFASFTAGSWGLWHQNKYHCHLILGLNCRGYDALTFSCCFSVCLNYTLGMSRYMPFWEEQMQMYLSARIAFLQYYIVCVVNCPRTPLCLVNNDFLRMIPFRDNIP